MDEVDGKQKMLQFGKVDDGGKGKLWKDLGLGEVGQL